MNMALNQALFMGSTGVVHRGRFDPEVILGLIARHRITTAILVPTQVGMLASHPLHLRLTALIHPQHSPRQRAALGVNGR